MMNARAYTAALEWYVDQDLAEALEDVPRSLRKPVEATVEPVKPLALKDSAPPPPALLVPHAALKKQAIEMARAAQTLEALQSAIADFDGISLKKTATNLVFSDGHPGASVMLVGEAPGADEDRQGKPFVGASGQLLDRILACVGLSRREEDPARAVYISNILNWRPPGNRTPSPMEIDLSLPFIERHIQLVAPKILILCGGVPAKALLGGDEQSISRLRGRWHDYKPAWKDGDVTPPIPAIATYHPAYLLRTPAQKRAVWQDMLRVNERRVEIGLIL